MKTLTPLSLLFAGLLLAGCTSPNESFFGPPPPSVAPKPVAPTQAAAKSTTKSVAKPVAPAPAPQPIVTPDTSLAANVVSYNSVGRFVVLNFPMNHFPKPDSTLFLYRGGLKVAQLKVSGPQRDTYVIADVVSGDARPGDVVRDQ